MSSFFDKLGILIRSKVGGITDDLGSSLKFGVNKSQVDKLRKQINSAVEYEEDIQKQISALSVEIANLNQQADQAVEQGQDATARHLIATIQRREQHLTLLQGDLETHQRMLNELILQVNQLDSVVSEQTAREPSTPATPSAQELEERVNKYQQVIDDSQSQISKLGEKIKAKTADSSASMVEQPNEPSEADVDDELEQRRNRLMKR
jgi:phage shock protein A